MKININTINELKEIASRWNWENLDDEWTILEGAYCRLSWVKDGYDAGYDEHDDEYSDILQDTLDLINTLQKEIQIMP